MERIKYSILFYSILQEDHQFHVSRYACLIIFLHSLENLEELLV